MFCGVLVSRSVQLLCATIAAKIANLKRGRPKEKGSNDPFNSVSIADAAAQLNVSPRHLTTSQRAAVVVKIANLKDGQRKSASSNEPAQAVSIADAAAQLKVGRRTD